MENLLITRNLVQPSAVMTSPSIRPEHFDEATVAALAHVDQQANRTLADNRPERTRKGYAQDWAAWTKFTTEHSIPLYAVTSGTLVLFVEWCWIQPGQKAGSFMAPSTIDRRITGTVVSARTDHDLRLPEGIAQAARQRLKQLTKAMEEAGDQRGRGKAPALLIEHIKLISDACPDNLEGLRDRAIVTMHFAVAGREHEIAHTRIRDYQDHPGGLMADLRVSKVKPRIVPVPYGTRPSTCPVRSWNAWKEARAQHGPLSDDDYAFCAIHWRNKAPQPGGLTPEAVGDILTRAGARAGIEIRFTGHSPRRGLATESRRAGHDQLVIAKQGGWSADSRTLAGYIEVVDEWEDNALIGIGL